MNVGGQAVEIDPTTAGVNVDIFGKALTISDNGNPNPLTIKDQVGNIYSFAPGVKIYDSSGQVLKVLKDYSPHWFEVIKPNAAVKGLTPEQQIENDINHPVSITTDQVQSGEWAQSILLSGLVKPFPKDWKFTGNAINHGGDSTNLYTSDKIPVNFFGVTNINGTNIGIRPWSVWNPAAADINDKKTPRDHSQVMIINAGVGEENLASGPITNYILGVYQGGPQHNGKNLQANLIISDPDSFLIAAEGPIVAQPSILALKNLAGNDPKGIPQIGNIINDDAGRKKAGIDLNLWQWGYTDQLPKELQNLIWLVYYS